MRFHLFCLAALPAFLSLATFAHAGMNADTKYTEKGEADFDTFLQLLNPYGSWSKIDGQWAYTPTDHEAPYTNGRWLYTEYGWYWKGTRPHSWATEHYGYWKRGDNKSWSWYPGSFWLPVTIEMRQTPGYIGWRSAEVDDTGSFVESPIDRYTKFDEWSFVTMAQFANPITPSTLAKADVVHEQLEDSTDSHHTYVTYREIERPGPHPADVARFCKDGGMLAPMTLAEQAQAYAPKPPPTNAAAHAPPVNMNGTNAPLLLGNAEDPSTDPNADRRKVKYWVTMSLPTFWTKPPPDARADQIYIYRPDMFQDEDGIQRRITLWFNPNARVTLKDVLNESPAPSRPKAATSGPALPAVPAAPADAGAEDGHNPFSSPLDVPFHEGKVASDASGSSSSPTTNAPPTGPAPSGLK